jgi:hypothetical protein
MAKTSFITGLLICFMTLLMLAGGCEKGLFEKKIRIKGQIEKGKQSTASGAKLHGKGFTLDDAEKVLIFYGRDYDLANISSNGTFTGKAPYGSATAVVFLTGKNEFIGYLVAGGINFLPLPATNNNLSVIDLSTLTLDGEEVIPANDPVGTTIQLTQEEIAFMQQVGSYYKALSKNLDMDKDGIPDILQNWYLDMNTDMDFNAGKAGLNSTPAEIIPPSQFAMGYGIHMVGSNNLLSSTANSVAENATLTGPVDSPYTDIFNAGNSYINNKEFKVNFARGNNPQLSLPFRPGEYTLNIDSRQFSFYYDNVNLGNYWLLVVPTFHTNTQNKVTHITFAYQFPDGTPANPRTLLRSGIDINISDQSYNRIIELLSEDNSNTDPSYDYTRIDLPSPVDIASIRDIGIRYTDLFGNRCGNSWRNE